VWRRKLGEEVAVIEGAVFLAEISAWIVVLASENGSGKGFRRSFD